MKRESYLMKYIGSAEARRGGDSYYRAPKDDIYDALSNMCVSLEEDYLEKNGEFLYFDGKALVKIDLSGVQKMICNLIVKDLIEDMFM